MIDGKKHNLNAIDFVYLLHCFDLSISDDAADEIISTDPGDSTYYADTYVSGDSVDILMVLMC